MLAILQNLQRYGHVEGKCPSLPQIDPTEKIVEGEWQHVTTRKNKLVEIGEPSGGLSGDRRNEYLVGEKIESGQGG